MKTPCCRALVCIPDPRASKHTASIQGQIPSDRGPAQTYSPKASDPGAGLTDAGGGISWKGSEQRKVPPICVGSSLGAEKRAARESGGADRPQEGVAMSYQLREPRQTPLPTSWFSGLCPQGRVPKPESRSVLLHCVLACDPLDSFFHVHEIFNCD